VIPAVERALANRGHLVRLSTESFPYLAIGAGGLDAASLRRLEKRNDVRRRRRRLQERGVVAFLPSQSPDGSPGLAEFFRLHNLRWDQKGNGSGIFTTNMGRRLVSDVANSWWKEGVLRLSMITLDDMPIAARFGVQLEGTYFGLKSAFDPTYAAFGPGHLITHAVLKHNIETGVRGMDFMRGAGEHKSAWADQERNIGYWAIGRGMPASLTVQLARAVLWTRHKRRDAT
jgi:CelD/BcsL family acetyltransferase involved in cellulose biosynthesis